MLIMIMLKLNVEQLHEESNAPTGGNQMTTFTTVTALLARGAFYCIILS